MITVINAGLVHSQEIKDKNRATLEECSAWATTINTSQLQFKFIHEENLPKKHTGVGLARKIGMDEAVARFELLKINGIIVCFDADATCDKNFLIEVNNHFQYNTNSPGCSVYYEHPIEGTEFQQEIYDGIMQYELHLRYYNQALNYCNLPYAYHTVGSSMAVRSEIYQAQGGMNKRKAGEDFYFIHKIIAVGGFTELKSTRIIPSPRISDRVPFGTGKAVGDWIESQSTAMLTYQFEIFNILKAFVSIVDGLYQTSLEDIDMKLSPAAEEGLKRFLKEQLFEEKLSEVRKNSKDLKSFQKRFFRWFDAFKVLKFVHFMRDFKYENRVLYPEVNLLFESAFGLPASVSMREQLELLREIERK